MKKLLIILLTIAISANTVNAQNEVDGKGLRKGEWFIAYTYNGNFPFYDYMQKLLNLDKILIGENETEKEDDYRVFEKVSYKKGIKQGDFSVYSAVKNRQGKYPQIAMGKYKDGKVEGNLIFLNYHDQKRLCSAIYENGLIKDQDIVIEEGRGGNEGMYGTSKENALVFGSQKVYPMIKIKDGVCIEETIIVHDKYKLVRFLKEDTGFTRYLYGRNMLSGIIDLSHCLEVAELDDNFKLNGTVSIYEETKIPFDTTKLNFRATYEEGKLNGRAYWYDAQSGNIIMECKYSKGYLNGLSRLLSADGKTYASARYKDGLLDGTFKTYYLNDGKNLLLKGPICEYKENKTIYTILTENSNTTMFSSTIPMLKRRAEVLTEGRFKIFENEYYQGGLDDDEYSLFQSNGKMLYKGVVDVSGIDCKETDWHMYDTSGKIIYSKKDADETSKQVQNIINNRNQQQSTSIQKRTTTSGQVEIDEAKDVSGQKKDNPQIGSAEMDGSTIRVYDKNGKSLDSFRPGGSQKLVGFNSKYVVTSDGTWIRVSTSKGRVIESWRPVSRDDWKVTSVTEVSITIDWDGNSHYFDFAGKSKGR